VAKDGKTKTWQARWRPKGDGRDTVRRTKTFKTKDDALDWLKQMEGKPDAYDPRKGAKRFADVAAEWLADRKADWEPSTYADYNASIRCWLTADRDPLGRRPPFGRVDAIHSGVIKEWTRGIAESSRSHRTLVKHYQCLRMILEFAKESGYIAASPCAGFKLPPPPKPEYDPATGDFIDPQQPDMTILTKDEIAKLADAMPNANYRTAVIFDAWMGLRAGELWGLQRRDVDLLHGTVKVRRAWKEVNGSHRGEARRTFLGPLKTQAARRDIHMPPFIAALMAEHLSQPGAPDSFVFRTETGLPVRHSRFYDKIFKPTVKAVLPHKAQLRFHDLRHTAASFILATSHDNLVLVKQRLGHEKIETTVNIYGHLVHDSDIELADRLDAYYAQPAQVVALAREAR
jgi:integrase